MPLKTAKKVLKSYLKLNLTNVFNIDDNVGKYLMAIKWIKYLRYIWTIYSYYNLNKLQMKYKRTN